MTVAELLGSATSYELTEWRAHFELKEQDREAAKRADTLAQLNRGRGHG